MQDGKAIQTIQRSHRLTVQLTPDEWAGVQTAAARLGTTVPKLAAFMLSMAAGQLSNSVGMGGHVVLFNNGIVANSISGSVAIANNVSNSSIVMNNTAAGDISVNRR
ncbi:hypothetical protein [Ruminiclostridium josui]|uniref:hypothetical protein n=1 Tax=Ruminiclostridium josui TaxID=1499 RepID=UPI000463A50B|nr:hypothetical protein [Ruminiclostridium josui]